jgi:16S rRNA (uracil1498-N3)-methyltransferase
MHIALLEPDQRPTPGTAITLTGDEARHLVRVRRDAVGDNIMLYNGLGSIADATITRIGNGREAGVTLDVTAARQHPKPHPHIEVWSASPKGDRLAAMVEELSQAGAASWTPMATRHGVVDPREAKLDRLRRIARESIKQCHRPWAMTIEEPAKFEDAFDGSARVLIADFDGRPPVVINDRAVRVLIGPEGGWADHERAHARANNADFVRLGPHVMRIGTAAVVGCAALMLAHHPDPPTQEDRR